MRKRLHHVAVYMFLKQAKDSWFLPGRSHKSALGRASGCIDDLLLKLREVMLLKRPATEMLHEDSSVQITLVSLRHLGEV